MQMLNIASTCLRRFLDHAIFCVAVKCISIMFEHMVNTLSSHELVSFSTNPIQLICMLGWWLWILEKSRHRPHYQQKNGLSQANVKL